ncbi:SemiSWEET family transporter [Candidatus Marsarchaeota archaeon]|jgi:MtN3 and saliva related transmembrane protein|nr:SemiSWEET family transporter [Candidatus Marsarchaeota archaeon]MCL5090207.1 SemiSWEET family transporter [Candidatus Marsarchaeota archaeon]
MLDFIPILGFAAGFILIIAYVPQVFKTIKTKSTKDISLLFTILIFTGDVLWIIYGIIINSSPLILTNSVLAILISPILIIKVKNDLKKYLGSS